MSSCCSCLINESTICQSIEFRNLITQMKYHCNEMCMLSIKVTGSDEGESIYRRTSSSCRGHFLFWPAEGAVYSLYWLVWGSANAAVWAVSTHQSCLIKVMLVALHQQSNKQLSCLEGKVKKVNEWMFLLLPCVSCIEFLFPILFVNVLYIVLCWAKEQYC